VEAIACRAHAFWCREIEIRERYVCNTGVGSGCGVLIRNCRRRRHGDQRNEDDRAD
jgi:hypothetical protein